jgi:hypothetical protein
MAASGRICRRLPTPRPLPEGGRQIAVSHHDRESRCSVMTSRLRAPIRPPAGAPTSGCLATSNGPAIRSGRGCPNWWCDGWPGCRAGRGRGLCLRPDRERRFTDLRRNRQRSARFSPAPLSRGVNHEAHVAGRPRAACRGGVAEDAIDGRLPSFATGGTSTSR